eukprot:7817795-Pyramimonas_sp.AAC.1
MLNIHNNITSFYGSSCANNGKGALNTPETLPTTLRYNIVLNSTSYYKARPSRGPQPSHGASRPLRLCAHTGGVCRVFR